MYTGFFRLSTGIRSAAGLVIGALVACGISNANAADKAKPATPHNINVAWLPDPTVAPIFIARDRGYFVQEGINPNLIKLQSGPAMFSVLKSGSADIGSMGLGPAVIAKAQGVDIQIVLTSVDVSTSNVLVSRERVKGISDLKGKRIASVKGATPYYGLSRALDAAGMTFRDIKFVDLAPGSIVPAFKNNDIDAAWVWSPWQNHLVKAGGHSVTNNSEIHAPAPNVWVVRTEWAKKNPEALIGFLRALNKGVLVTNKEPEIAASILTEQMQVDSAMAREILKGNTYYSLQDQLLPDQPLSLKPKSDGSPSGLSKAAIDIATFFSSEQKVQMIPDVATFVNSKPAEAALGRK